MNEQGLNAALFYENPDPKTYISMVPTSAHSGEGMGNLIGMLVNLSQTMLAKRLADGWRSHSVLATAFGLTAGAPHRMLLALLPEDGYTRLLEHERMIGAIVNENNKLCRKHAR